jgi:hypothetical protein
VPISGFDYGNRLCGFGFHGQSRLCRTDWETSSRTEHGDERRRPRSRHHTRQQAERLHETLEHLREDIAKPQDPRAQALFETAAEMLSGLEKAFRDYEAGTEPAWKR